MDGGQTIYGPIERIPSESQIAILGHSALGAMVDIEWHGHRYAAFVVDVQQRCVPETDGTSRSNGRSQPDSL